MALGLGSCADLEKEHVAPRRESNLGIALGGGHACKTCDPQGTECDNVAHGNSDITRVSCHDGSWRTCNTHYALGKEWRNGVRSNDDITGCIASWWKVRWRVCKTGDA